MIITLNKNEVQEAVKLHVFSNLFDPEKFELRSITRPSDYKEDYEIELIEKEAADVAES